MMRHWLATRLRYLADRLDLAHAPRYSGFSFTFESDDGIRFRHDGKGPALWYMGDEEYQRAWDESDSLAWSMANDSSPVSTTEPALLQGQWHTSSCDQGPNHPGPCHP